MLPDNKRSEPGYASRGGMLALRERQSCLLGSFSKGHGAMKALQGVWLGTNYLYTHLSAVAVLIYISWKLEL